MVIFRHSNRRGRFRSNDRSFKRTGDVPKYKSDFNVNGDFKRNSLSRNNHNASKLVEKYNDLAREALANEDKILSESYFQYADHFMRVLKERETNKPIKEINDFAKNKIHVSSEEENKANSQTNKEVEKKTANS